MKRIVSLVAVFAVAAATVFAVVAYAGSTTGSTSAKTPICEGHCEGQFPVHALAHQRAAREGLVRR